MKLYAILSRLPLGAFLLRWLPAAFSVLWCAGIAAGSVVLWKYENTPSASFEVPKEWPSASRIPIRSGKPTLVMFAHPHCPCTSASLGELARLLARHDGIARVHVLFYKPRGASPDWMHTSLWREAAGIPGVELDSDENGNEAKRFGAGSSGFVVLYDTAGRLCYSGGITAERGHSGDSNGGSAIAAILESRVAATSAMPAFGCSIFQTSSKCTNGHQHE